MRIKITILFLFVNSLINAQLIGLVTDKNEQPLPFVNIYLQNSYTGTTTNNEGKYEITLSKLGKYTIVYQYLGYKTIKKEVNILSFPYVINITLSEDAVVLNEVKISSKENPANAIIRQAIENRKENLLKSSNYTADFYSRGLFRIKNAPKKILGQDLGDFGGGLDSTRSGVLYLSETISKLTKSQKKFKEHITSSKVSGNDNGFSFNQASDVNFSLYKNVVEIGENIISPIAGYAFNFYRYKLINSFTEGNHLINKIKVIPKRATDNVFEGFIYIVEETWALYGVTLSVTGKQLQMPAVKKLILTQNYLYSNKDDLWSIFSQSIDFKFGILGINIDGRFTAVYSNYDFQPNFERNHFTNEVLSFDSDANKKDTAFWKKIRPVPLTLEEVKDYTLKDSIKTIRKSKKYLDSVDLKRNSLGLSNLLFGYTHKNSYKNWNVNIGSPILNSQYNTVQGWHTNMAIYFFKNYKKKNQMLWVNSSLDYGFSDKIFRPSGRITYRFNNKTRPFIYISGGKTLSQFNQNNPIKPLVNTVTSLVFEKNYAKFYDKTFLRIGLGKEIINGLRITSSLAYEDRKPVINTTNYVIFNRGEVVFSSNNPLTPTNFTEASFDANHIYKFSLNSYIRFAQKYISLPNKKINLQTNMYPSINLNYTKGFAASNSKYNYELLEARIFQNIGLGNKGYLSYNIKAGKFLSVKKLSFTDYKHFNGNQTHVNWSGDYINSFNLLPYYDLSTKNEFAEFHFAHNFDGYLLRKLPILNKLQYKLVFGANFLLTKENKPYTEYSIGFDNIGFGKFRFLRIDYVQSTFNNNRISGLLFGINF